MEDVKTGVSITDLSLNDFRMDLLNFTKENGNLSGQPKGLHAIVASNPANGMQPSIIFALRNIHQDLHVNQQNRLHPYYLVYLDNDTNVIADQTDVSCLLDLIRSSCKGLDQTIKAFCDAFNAETKDGREMGMYPELLSDAIKSMIEVKEERDLDSLFSGRHTTALTHTFAGLDDIEPLAFIVVRDPA